MRTWDDEFGYELVDDDMRLKYSKPDPQLEQLLKKAIQVSKRRQEVLAASMPSAYGGGRRGGSSGAAYVASRRGGFVPAGGTREVNRTGSFGQGADSRLSDGSRGTTDEQNPIDRAPAPGTANQQGNSTTGNARSSLQNPGGPAGNRGQNWGLPGARAGATGITRPIRVACAHDRLVILPDRGDQQMRPRVITVHGPLADHVDVFVSHIWAVMDTWGLAVMGGYWKPVLHVEVPTGGERRFQELRAALRNSGLDIKRIAR